MKPHCATRSTNSLTRVEAVVVIAIIGVLAGMLLSGLLQPKKRASRIHCISNVRQVAISFRVWASDHNEKFPMQVPVAKGGSWEWVESGLVAPHYGVMSNELTIPKILICPNDRTRKGALSFGTNLTEANISYFVSVDTALKRPCMLLAGDCKITLDGEQLKPGLWLLSTNQNVGWTRRIHGWDQNAGNVALADGTVRQVNGSGLRELLANSAKLSNRLAIP